jgi:hypothetical protein
MELQDGTSGSFGTQASFSKRNTFSLLQSRIMMIFRSALTRKNSAGLDFSVGLCSYIGQAIDAAARAGSLPASLPPVPLPVASTNKHGPGPGASLAGPGCLSR